MTLSDHPPTSWPRHDEESAARHLIWILPLLALLGVKWAATDWIRSWCRPRNSLPKQPPYDGYPPRVR